jgi:hypothetical protein
MPENYDDLIEPASQPHSLDVVVRNVLTGHYPPAADRAGFEAYFETIMIEVNKAEPRARGAAMNCEVGNASTVWTALQKTLFAAVVRFRLNDLENPDRTNREVRAEAFARIIADAVDSGVEQWALHQATLRPLSEREKIELDAQRRDEEFERNRRPRPKPLYPV